MSHNPCLSFLSTQCLLSTDFIPGTIVCPGDRESTPPPPLLLPLLEGVTNKQIALREDACVPEVASVLGERLTAWEAGEACYAN